jgi:uncharacterized protein (DUF58 family)
VIGNLFLLILLTGLFLFVPYTPIRFVLVLFILMRIWSVVARILLPRFISITRDNKSFYALCHRPFDLEIRVKNRSPFPISYFVISDELTGLVPIDRRERALSLKPFEERSFTYRVVGDNRGINTSGPVSIKAQGPLRLYSWSAVIDSLQSIIVYPRVYRVELAQQRGISGGSIKISNRLFEDVTSFQSLREYIPGDELKRVNWKVSARLGKLYSMEYDSTIHFPVHIILNLSEGEYPLTHRKELMERAIETAASLAVFFIRMGQKVSLISSGFIPMTDDDKGKDREPLFLSGEEGVEQSALILKTLAAISSAKEGLSFIDLFSRPENPLRRGTKNLIIGPPPLTEDSNFLYEHKRKGRDLEYFMIIAKGSGRDKLLLSGINTYTIMEYGEGLISER